MCSKVLGFSDKRLLGHSLVSRVFKTSYVIHFNVIYEYIIGKLTKDGGIFLLNEL
jgi:hypothetical protein